MTEFPPNQFWDFSLKAYARERVAEACLALQDRRGIDVNLGLFCCWAGSQGRALTPADLEQLVAAVRPWQKNVVRPLREIRRWLKDQQTAPADLASPFRDAIKAHELEAERIEQQMLASLLPDLTGKREGAAALAAANLAAYCAAVGFTPDAADRADLAAILGGCFPEALPSDLALPPAG